MNEASDFVLFLGRFHPLLVHLPIGFLVFAFTLELFSRWKKDTTLTAAIPLALLLSAVSALGASILGYMLSLSGDYEESMVDSHLWFGVATTVFTFVAWLIRIERIKIPKLDKLKTNVSALTLLVILVSVTGHYGGNLTHGSDYLVKYAPFNKSENSALVPVEKIEEAVVYDYLVEPILANKCASCHNESKKKGGLSFQDSLAILKGGKNGEVLLAGNSLKSEMIKRVLLEPHHEDFMPPEGKTPLTEEETNILKYWIDNANGNFKVKVAAVETPENIIEIGSTMLGLAGASAHGGTQIPTVSTIDPQVLQNLKAAGFNAKELVFDSNIFEIELPSYNMKEGVTDITKEIELLSKIKDNILWLYIEDNKLSDANLKTISTFKNLQKLVINRNPISDNGVKALEALENLHSLNIYNTSISKASLETFSKMKNLKTVYAWNSKITEEDLTTLPEDKNLKIILEF